MRSLKMRIVLTTLKTSFSKTKIRRTILQHEECRGTLITGTSMLRRVRNKKTYKRDILRCDDVLKMQEMSKKLKKMRVQEAGQGGNRSRMLNQNNLQG